MDYKVTAVGIADPNATTGDPLYDVLCIEGTDPDGNDVKAVGWVSVTTNHFDADAYYPEGSLIPQEGVDEEGKPLPDRDMSGHLKPDAKPRKLTKSEVGDYALARLIEQNAETTPPTPTPIPFS